VENSPILTLRGLHDVLRDLAEMGYNAKWGVISAGETGAPHERKRIWIVGYSMQRRCTSESLQQDGSIQRERTKTSTSASIRKTNPFLSEWWKVEPDVGRVVDGLANDMDRIAAIGNGQVPAVVKAAWEILGPK
jgi:DNA (cytosine-5)-methyltransferase 1